MWLWRNIQRSDKIFGLTQATFDTNLTNFFLSNPKLRIFRQLTAKFVLTQRKYSSELRISVKSLDIIAEISPQLKIKTLPINLRDNKSRSLICLPCFFSRFPAWIDGVFRGELQFPVFCHPLRLLVRNQRGVTHQHPSTSRPVRRSLQGPRHLL